VICSLRKSKSSSQLSKLFCAAVSFKSKSDSASSRGYASITFAPSQRYTSSVAGTSALAKSVSLSSKVVSSGSASDCACSVYALQSRLPIPSVTYSSRP